MLGKVMPACDGWALPFFVGEMRVMATKTTKKKAVKKVTVKKTKGAVNARQVVVTDKMFAQVPSLSIGTCTITIEGDDDSFLLVHQFSAKARRMIEGKQGKGATIAREARDPVNDYHEAAYQISGDFSVDHPDPRGTGPLKFKDCEGVHGMPAGGIKKAMIRAAKIVGAVMTDTRPAFRIIGTAGDNLVPIKFKTVEMDTRPVRLNGKTTDLRYRPLYRGWSCDLTIRYMTCLIGPEQLFNLLNHAGFGVGLCEHRQEKDGSNGAFHVTGMSHDSVEDMIVRK